jgi:hypothetical protein
LYRDKVGIFHLHERATGIQNGALHCQNIRLLGLRFWQAEEPTGFVAIGVELA